MNIKETCYSILDLILLGKGISRNINGLNIVFPSRYFKYYEKNYEEESFAFVKSKIKKGDIVLDIGGHIGLYAVFLGKLVGKNGKVYTFEPTPNTNKVLRQTIKLNNLEEIISVRDEAVSKQKGTTFFYISNNPTDNSNSLINYTRNRVVEGINISLLSIDEFCKSIDKKVNFIKIDAEGAELDVLLGAKKTMEQQRPACILALHPYQIQSKGDSLEAIWNLVNNYNYSIQGLQNKEIKKDEFCKKENLFDVYLIPR